MSPATNLIEVKTRDREHLSAVLFRTLGTVTPEILTDTIQRNPHLTELPALYPENVTIVIKRDIETNTEAQVQTLW